MPIEIQPLDAVLDGAPRDQMLVTGVGLLLRWAIQDNPSRQQEAACTGLLNYFGTVPLQISKHQDCNCGCQQTLVTLVELFVQRDPTCADKLRQNLSSVTNPSLRSQLFTAIARALGNQSAS